MFTCGNEKPAATAKITGSEKYNTISGRVDFYDTYGGTGNSRRTWESFLGIPHS